MSATNTNNQAVTFTQTDDWSYANNTSPTTNANIAVDARGSDASPIGGKWPKHDQATQLTLAKQKIKHVIIIMQENRSFDNYFGTFPAPTGYVIPPGGTFPNGGTVDGVSRTPTDFRTEACNNTSYSPGLLGATDANFGTDLPHNMIHAKRAFGCPNDANPPDESCTSTCGVPPNTWTCSPDNGPYNYFRSYDPLYMKDFLDATNQYDGCNDAAFKQTAGHYQGWPASSPTTHDVLWNYWTIAQNGLLQQRMFAPVPSYSKMSHLFMVSGWSANCTGLPCSASQQNYDEVGEPYGWNQIAGTMTRNGVSWQYYKGEDWDPTCASCGTTLNSSNNYGNCFNTATPTAMVWFWNPLANFSGVNQNNINPLQKFLDVVNQGCPTNCTDSSVAKVSWIVPSIAMSEHPGSFTGTDAKSGKPYNAPNVDIRRGQAYTTMLLKQIMKNTALWNSSVVLLAWDDWGGFYDHVRPPVDPDTGRLMYGVRVPGLVVSPFLGVGAIDDQTLSFDAYLKLIEDLFLNGARLTGDGRPTPVREAKTVLGNLLDELDFHRTPTAAPAPITGLSCQYSP